MTDEKERNIDEAMGFEFIDGEIVPIFELTEEQEREFYAAGLSGLKGLRLPIQNQMGVRNKT